MTDDLQWPREWCSNCGGMAPRWKSGTAQPEAQKAGDEPSFRVQFVSPEDIDFLSPPPEQKATNV